MLTGFDPAAAPFRLPPADQVNPAVPAHVSAALARATNNDPEQRFASAAEMRQALGGPVNLVQRTAQPSFAQAIGPATAFGPGAQTGGAPAQSTSLARVALWMGAISLGAMVIALIMVGIDAATPGDNNSLAGAGALLGLLPLLAGPSAAIVGVVALSRAETRATARGRRDAAIAVAAGLATLLLCCVMIGLFPSSPKPESDSALPSWEGIGKDLSLPEYSSTTFIVVNT
jgi:serine/threonine-protein kinase